MDLDLNLNNAPLQKKYELLPNNAYTAKEVGKMAGVALKRIYDLVDSDIIQPVNIVKKGDEIRNFTYYDAINILEVYLINRLISYSIPKRTIKDFFGVIRDNRNILNPFKILEFKGIAYLCFYHDSDNKIAFTFFDKKRDFDKFLANNPVCFFVNLKSLSSDLFQKVESLY